MIIRGEYESYDETLEAIVIDLSSKNKYKNRVLGFYEERNSINHEIEYRISAQWTPNKHPAMILKASEIIELADALNEWVAKIKSTP